MSNSAGTVHSIEPVLAEIREGTDDLTQWANARPPTFFRPVDAAAAAQLSRVVQWVQVGDFRRMRSGIFWQKRTPF